MSGETMMKTTSAVRARWRPALAAPAAVLAVVVLVVVVVGRGGGPPVIHLRALEGVASVAPMEEGDVDDMEVWGGIEYRFVLAEGAHFGAAESTAWRFEPPADLNASVARLATRLGVVGDLRASPHGDGSVVVGPDDGTGATLWVGAMGDWRFTAPSVLPRDPCAEPTPQDLDRLGDAAVDAAGQADCEPATAPATGPDEAEARRAAETFFVDVDLPLTPQLTDVLVDQAVTWVSGSLPVGGQDTDVFVSVAFGPDLDVAAANGTLARPIEVEGYPTIDAEAAVARVQQQHVWHDWGKVLADPESSEPSEVRTVTLVAAEPCLVQVVDVDQTVWLLPGVRLIDADGGSWEVVTVADAYLVQATSDEVGTPEPAPIPVDTDPEESRPPPLADPDPADAEAEAIAADLVGLSEKDAVDLVEHAGFVARVVSRDGDVEMTDDYRADRINLSIADGVVTLADVG
jgi:hypothetical protein